MKNSIIKIGLLFITIFMLQNSVAQKKNGEELSYENLIKQLQKPLQSDSFHLIRSQFLDMERSTEYPILIDLNAGRWYHFIVVGDPEMKKMDVKLFLRSIGNIVTEKLKPEDNGHEYWTQFSFVCPKQGRYILMLNQKGPRKKLKGHLSFYAKRGVQGERGMFGF